MIEDNPLDLENIKEKQDEDNDLQQSLTKHPTWYCRKNINDVDNILCYTKPGDNAANWKIVLPKDLTLSRRQLQNSFVINVRLVIFLVKLTCQKSNTAHLP